jgi:hypothetical protein
VHSKGVCQQILQHLGGLLDATIFFQNLPKHSIIPIGKNKWFNYKHQVKLNFQRATN